MRKWLITPTSESIRTHGPGWLDIERAAVVEVTSEDKDFPVEAAFVSGDSRGWRAAIPGSQTIRVVASSASFLCFAGEQPCSAAKEKAIRRIRLQLKALAKPFAIRNC